MKEMRIVEMAANQINAFHGKPFKQKVKERRRTQLAFQFHWNIFSSPMELNAPEESLKR